MTCNVLSNDLNNVNQRFCFRYLNATLSINADLNVFLSFTPFSCITHLSNSEPNVLLFLVCRESYWHNTETWSGKAECCEAVLSAAALSQWMCERLTAFLHLEIWQDLCFRCGGWYQQNRLNAVHLRNTRLHRSVQVRRPFPHVAPQLTVKASFFDLLFILVPSKQIFPESIRAFWENTGKHFQYYNIIWI